MHIHVYVTDWVYIHSSVLRRCESVFFTLARQPVYVDVRTFFYVGASVFMFIRECFMLEYFYAHM